MSHPTAARAHGGPHAAGPVRWDFSTNVNAAGPCPQALAALAGADASRYPDSGYHALRERLAAWHGVARERIVLAASASEFIQRITAVGSRLAPGPVAMPARAYGDYAAAARAWRRGCTSADDTMATLRWCADPGSPLGQAAPAPPQPGDRPTVLDAAYAPLRLHGTAPWTASALDGVFQLWTPNKALGLPGIRGAYAIVPARAEWPVPEWCAALREAEPSWPLGAHAVALLQAWTEPPLQDWLHTSLATLRGWTNALSAGLAALNLDPQPSVTPFLCARRPAAATDAWLHRRGLAVRDATSFGMAGWMRVSAQAPAAREVLLRALDEAISSSLHTLDRGPTDPHHP